MALINKETLIKANWPAPINVQAFFTTRHNGVSSTPYHSLNLGEHVGDLALNVKINRNIIQQKLSLTSQPLWLNQIHGHRVIDAKEHTHNMDGDAIISHLPAHALAIMTADCLPILICTKKGDGIAAIHGGWKSLHQDIIQHTLKKLNKKPSECMAWLGPCISQAHFEIGNEVKEMFFTLDPRHNNAFALNEITQKYHGCLKTIAKNQLRFLGLNTCYQSNECTFKNSDDFFSYRRQAITGRMATFIWMDQHA